MDNTVSTATLLIFILRVITIDLVCGVSKQLTGFRAKHESEASTLDMGTNIIKPKQEGKPEILYAKELWLYNRTCAFQIVLSGGYLD